MLHDPASVGQLAFEVQTAPLALQVPAFAHCALLVHALPVTEHAPVVFGQLALLVHAAPLTLQLPGNVAQLAFAVHATPLTLHCPGTVGQLASL